MAWPERAELLEAWTTAYYYWRMEGWEDEEAQNLADEALDYLAEGTADSIEDAIWLVSEDLRIDGPTYVLGYTPEKVPAKYRSLEKIYKASP
jgi:hypothetical protein